MRKILVIDDDEQFRHYVATLLERSGFQVQQLASATGLADALNANGFDAINLRHEEVGHHRVERLARHDVEKIAAVRERADLEAGALQEHAQVLAEQIVVVDDKNFGHSSLAA